MADVWELASLDLVFLCSTFWSSVLALVMTAALGSTSLGCAALRLLWHQALNRHEVVVKKKNKTVQQVRKKKKEIVRRASLYMEWSPHTPMFYSCI